MNVLILGQDQTFFEQGTISDTQARHLRYAEELRRRTGEKSSIRVISYAQASKQFSPLFLGEGLSIYPANSAHRLFFLLAILRALPEVLRDWKPDVVTVQHAWEEGLIGKFVAQRCGARFIPQLHFDMFSREWKDEQVVNELKFFLAKRIFRGADRIRVVSQGLKEKAIAHFSFQPEAVDTVPVAVNFQPETRNSSRKEDIWPGLSKHPVVLFVGRFCAAKNLPRFLSVARQINSQNRNVRFVFVGDGALLDETKKQVNQLKLAEHCIFLGAVPYERLPAIYGGADLLLLTSDHEGFGRVIVEAFLTGVPVVATRCDGPQELIDQGLDGFLVERSANQELAKRSLQLLEDPAMNRQFGRYGQQKMITRYKPQRLISQLISCWMGELSDSEQKQRASTSG